MTCIVAVAKKGSVYIGADSYGSNGFSGTYVANPKCFINGEFLIGCTSTFRSIDLFNYKLEIPKVHEDEHDNPDQFMRTHFVEAIRRVLRENGHLIIENGLERGVNFLVGYRGKVYEVQQDFSVLNIPDYGCSVGSGENAARGSLYTTRNSKMNPGKRVLAALEAAAAVNVGVRGPFIQVKIEDS